MIPLICNLCVVIDASFLVALCAQEIGRFSLALALLERYESGGVTYHAPNVLVAEALYALCKKYRDETLNEPEYRRAIHRLHTAMEAVFPPQLGEASLMLRAEQIREGYGCSHSADSLYIALAEELHSMYPTELVTFDSNLHRLAAHATPAVNVRLLGV